MTEEPWDGSVGALEPPAWWATQKPLPPLLITQQDIRDMSGWDGNQQAGVIRKASNPGALIPRRGIHHLTRQVHHETVD